MRACVCVLVVCEWSTRGAPRGEWRLRSQEEGAASNSSYHTRTYAPYFADWIIHLSVDGEAYEVTVTRGRKAIVKVREGETRLC